MIAIHPWVEEEVPEPLARKHELVAALPELAAANGLQLGAIPADVVVDAASALRCRELQAPT